MTDAAKQLDGGPSSRRDAAMRIILGELHETFDRAEALMNDVQSVEKQLKETARTVQDSARMAQDAARIAKAAATAPEPVALAAPNPQIPRALLAIVGVLAGLVASLVVVAGMYAFNRDRDDAKVGRAVRAAFPTLAPATQAKLQTAINKAPEQ